MFTKAQIQLLTIILWGRTLMSEDVSGQHDIITTVKIKTNTYDQVLFVCFVHKVV